MSETPWVNAQSNTPPEPPDDPGTKTNYPVGGADEPGVKARNDEPPVDVVKTHYSTEAE